MHNIIIKEKICHKTHGPNPNKKEETNIVVDIIKIASGKDNAIDDIKKIAVIG